MGSKLTGYIKNERRRGSSAKRLYNPGSLGPLAAGAFYHDVGLISAEPWCPGGPKPSVTEQTWLDAHTVRGDEMLKGKISSIARMVIRQHHENSDGSGYPKKVAGDKINVYARIVRVADAYCSATAPQACLKNSSAPSVLYEMLYGEQRKCYDEEVLQVLARVIQPFPNGAQLKLQTGKTAVVVGHNRRDPFKPKVVIVFDEQGRLTPEKSLKTSFFLSDRHDHQIASCGAEDLAFISEGLFSVKSGNGIDFKEQLVSANISHNTHTGKIG